MALYPKATLKLLPENNTAPSINPTTVILHSAVDSIRTDSLYNYFARADVTVESHFFVKWDGEVEQYMDTSKRADANYKANPFAISIETEDDGSPDQRPWSPAQVRSIIELLIWIKEVHDIPAVLAKSWRGPGIGMHAQFPEWSIYKGKTCPGLARQPQVPGIIHAVATNNTSPPEDAHMSAEDVDRLEKTLGRWMQEQSTNVINGVNKELDELRAKIDLVQKEVQKAERLTVGSHIPYVRAGLVDPKDLPFEIREKARMISEQDKHKGEGFDELLDPPEEDR